MAKKVENSSKYVKYYWFTFSGLLLIFSILFILTSAGYLGFMPSFEELENPKSNLASEIYSADQVLLGKYYVENRSNIHYNDLSPTLINALIATEDIRFYQHSGIDVTGTFAGIFSSLIGEKRGASTITQQLAKNLFPREENPSFMKLISIKIKEWITGLKLERNYTKNEILAMYFNTVDFGNQSFGIKSAARTYFNKEPKYLNVEEAAMLVGMLKAPSWYNPVRNPERALKRRNVVLHQMMKYDFLTQNEYDSLKNLTIDLTNYKLQDHNSGLATYFREYLRGYLDEWTKNRKKPDGTNYDLYKDGLKIYTTINSKMQRYAEEAVSEYIGQELQPSFFKHWKGVPNAPFNTEDMKPEDIRRLYNLAMKRSDRYIALKNNHMPDDSIKMIFNKKIKMKIFSWKGEIDTFMSPMDSIKYYKYFLQCGFMSMEPQTGYVRAYVGGINYKHFKYDHVKIGRRQVGSTFKPFLYALAMQEGEFSPCTEIPNIPVSFDMPDGTKWIPKNSSDDREGEMVTLKWALANSVNYISAYLMKRYSPQAVIKIGRKMGIYSPLEPVYSLCLGTADISVYEMVGANSTFANKGVYVEPIFITRIEDKNGSVLEVFRPKTDEAVSEETAYLMLDLMKGVVEEGTSVRLRYKYKLLNPIAGKTGTTQNNSDGWFMGITPDLVSGLWVGCEDRSIHFRTIDLGQGANMALPIWAIYMQKVYADKTLNISQEDFEKPTKPLSVEIDCYKYKKTHKSNDAFGIDNF